MLPQFGISEFLLIAILALIVVGPKDLPLMMRRLGQWVGQAKRMANEFRGAFDDIARQAELDELRKEIEDLKKNNSVEQAMAELKETEDQINASVLKEEASQKKDTSAASKAEPKEESTGTDSSGSDEDTSDKKPVMTSEPNGER
ncbi:MAG: twin-arginine translocase subunit TatB [Ponticaulis sp.]|nr:twin-arginine translocase subunit TatB [Ponticaulis sp.]|tara:strand:+ start:4707 stop:5141 length:435 start_codon:yes stop_codon:yes gene_type:complete